ncbi:hypothetical protein GALL_409570 [mine drainage metagenome]|uniref:DUF2442 domain-containing protein n=1 Tax=mine drainage metagenome TaxID=410659 RepID=A0A1J5Q116_9ZZZZ
MAITDADVKRAEGRMQARMKAGPRAVSARYDRRSARVVVHLDTGLELAFPSHLAQGLDQAKPDDLADIEISPSGLGLHFPKLDADLYLPPLLEGTLGSRKWMARQMGKAGGLTKTPVKAAASRENGKLGGRPRKVTTA